VKPHHHKYKNIILFALGLFLAYYLSRNAKVNEFLLHLGNYKYLSAFLGGVLFVSTFTLPIGSIILLTLARTLSPFLLILIAGIGAVLGDVLIFKFFKNKMNDEAKPIYKEVESIVGKNHLKKIIHTKYFAWTLPVIGTFILASPLPDELGVSIMGLSNMSTKKFLLVSWFSHTLGVFFIIGTLT
jgi:uncharacterized membrane protein YdjX (TVP38/TMEM64 family)